MGEERGREEDKENGGKGKEAKEEVGEEVGGRKRRRIIEGKGQGEEEEEEGLEV